MSRSRMYLLLAIVLTAMVSIAVVLRAQSPASPGQRSKVPQEAPAVGPRFDVNNLGRTVDPCTDFYRYACGAWMDKNPIPADQAEWGRFNELIERNRAILRGILEKATADDPQRGAVEQKVGDYYASCMDEKTVEEKGLAPLQPELQRIAALRSKAELPAEVAHLHQSGAGVLFSFTSGQDFKDASQVIAQADQGGLGLPDRDYYLKSDQKSQETRAQYLRHVENMFQLLGESPGQANADARRVMNIETALAKSSLDLVSRRDPEKIYHRLSRAELASLDPSFAWEQYLKDVNQGEVASLNVAVPDFFQGMDSLLKTVALDDWKTYLRWHVVHNAAPMLPARFVNENFDFYGRTLTGAEQLRPRWKRCVSYTDNDLGEALGQPYVELTFGAQGKQRTLKMVRALEKALGEDIRQLPWMGAATRQQALEKLQKIANKIGYPDRWRDYSRLEIIRGEALGNSMRANAFEFNRQLAKIGKPVDRGEWQMSPPTVNAYYDPQMNDINFPAGILQPPFYDNNLDDAVNFGGIGYVIGHELTHGFDDEGAKFDASGNLKNWWMPADEKEFGKRTRCIEEEYSSFTAVDDVKVNGKLTLGENTADNGGLRIALMALKESSEATPAALIAGFTPEQRLFLSFAQVQCENVRPEVVRLQALTDPHSPGKWRVNGAVSNMAEFQQAFHCQAGAPMARPNACRVW